MGHLTRSPRSMWRLALANAAVLVVGFVVLAVSPAPVTFPSSHWEAALLAAAAAVMLVGNIAVAGAGAAAEIRRGRRAATETDDVRRLRRYEHCAVVAPDGVIGVVSEVLGDRDGTPRGLLVEDGWFGARRFLVPLDAVDGVDEVARELYLRLPGEAATPPE